MRNGKKCSLASSYQLPLDLEAGRQLRVRAKMTQPSRARVKGEPNSPSSPGLFPETSRWHHPTASFQKFVLRLRGDAGLRAGMSPHLDPPTPCT